MSAILQTVKLRSCHHSCSDSHVWLLAALWTAARQASLSFAISQSLLKLMSVESVMPSNHPILYHPLLLLVSIFPSIRVFSNELALLIRWPKYWSFSFGISPSSECSGLISLADKDPSSQSYGFSSSHVWMQELECKGSWELKNWCFWTVVDSWESPGLQGNKTNQS